MAEKLADFEKQINELNFDKITQEGISVDLKACDAIAVKLTKRVTEAILTREFVHTDHFKKLVNGLIPKINLEMQSLAAQVVTFNQDEQIDNFTLAQWRSIQLFYAKLTYAKLGDSKEEFLDRLQNFGKAELIKVMMMIRSYTSDQKAKFYLMRINSPGFQKTMFHDQQRLLIPCPNNYAVVNGAITFLKTTQDEGNAIAQIYKMYTLSRVNKKFSRMLPQGEGITKVYVWQGEAKVELTDLQSQTVQRVKDVIAMDNDQVENWLKS